MLSTAPVTASLICTVSARPLSSQSSRYSSRLCASPSARSTSTREAGGRVPGGGDAVSRAGNLQGAGVGGGGGPGVGRLAGGRDRVAGREAGRAGDDVVAVGAVVADPCPLRRRVVPDERRGARRVEEQAAQDGAWPGRPGDRDHDVAADGVVQVRTRLERRDRLSAQHGARGRVGDLHRLGPTKVVPVGEVQLEAVLRPVAQVDVDGEAGGRVPVGGDAVGCARDL